jgi:hypothetical protein
MIKSELKKEKKKRQSTFLRLLLCPNVPTLILEMIINSRKMLDSSFIAGPSLLNNALFLHLAASALSRKQTPGVVPRGAHK